MPLVKQTAIMFLTVCLALAHAECHGAHRARETPRPVDDPTGGPIVDYSGQDLKKMVGQRLRATGVASDAKAGGVIVPAEYPLYVEGVKAWPPPLIGATLEVIGTVDRIPPSSPGAAGIPGGATILRHATWRRLTEAPAK